MHPLKLIPSLALAASLVSCAVHSPAPAPKSTEAIRYRYENTLDLRADNTLNHVLILGYDDSNPGEATRLVVSAGGAPLALRNQTDVHGAMYNPAVELTKKGTLIVRWDVIGDCSETVELAADPDGNLTAVKRSKKVS